MTLLQLSEDYASAAELLSGRIALLRQQEKTEEDAERRFMLHRRILDLQPMLRQCRQLHQLTAHYYERGFYRDERFTL